MANESLSSQLDIGPAHELFLTLGKAGWTKKDLADVTKDLALCSQLLALKRGELEVKPIDPSMVDLDADPYLPDGWKVEEHNKGGKLKLERRGDDLFPDGKKIEFFLSDKQKGNKSIEGNKLRKELVKKPVLNANLLDHLLAHPELIPESLKKDKDGNTIYLFFWGTIYRYSDDGLCVRYLCWYGDRWDWHCSWLGCDFGFQSPAALLAS